ncbi:MAG: hypothetical protein IH987_06850 [Planctomycetes bacterium]|nr:hypothetical protein [Planctomycetota bacterium]
MVPSQTDTANETASVVITGAGLVTSLGLNVEDTWRALIEGRSGIAPLTAIESPLSSNKGGGQAPDVVSDQVCGDLRETTYLQMAITEALQGADCLANLPYPPHRCGVLLGTTLHGMRQAGSFIRSDDFAPLEWFLAGDILRVAMEPFGLRGMASSICSACSSGLASIAMAETLLSSDQFDLLVAGGYDPISEYAYGGFNSMRLITEGRIRNFCRGRDGMKLGEGYGIVVLERERDAARRGARPLAAVLGFGESCDAHHLSKPHPEGRGAAIALGQALSSADVHPSAVGMVAAHSTATPDNDAAEYAALETVFGDDLASVPVVAFKSYIGHTLGGAGAVELILSALAIRDKIVPPTNGVEPDEVEFDALSLRKDAMRKRDLRATVNTSLGFGGANTCMVIGPPSASESTSDKASLHESHLQRGAVGSASSSKVAETSPTDPVITGIGVILPGAVGNDAFGNLLDRPNPDPLVADPGEVDDKALAGLLEARRVRRMSSYVKLTLAATTLALDDARIERQSELTESCAALLGTNYGSTIYCERYYRQLIEQGIDAANPMLFAEGVPNAAAAHLSTTFGVKGFCQTLIGTRTAGLEGILLAAARIRSGRWDRVLVGAAEEYAKTVNDAHGYFGLYGPDGRGRRSKPWRRFVTGAGAVTLVLESRRAAEKRGATIRGRIVATASGVAPRTSMREAVATVRRIWSDLDRPRYVVSSANDTWLDRMEAAGLRTRRKQNHPEDSSHDAIVGSVYGHIGECFSVLPLAALAAVLLTGRMPRWAASPVRGVFPARGSENPDRFAVLGSDYAGSVVGVSMDSSERV